MERGSFESRESANASSCQIGISLEAGSVQQDTVFDPCAQHVELALERERPLSYSFAPQMSPDLGSPKIETTVHAGSAKINVSPDPCRRERRAVPEQGPQALPCLACEVALDVDGLQVQFPSNPDADEAKIAGYRG